MDVAEFGEREGDHAASTVELHGAAAKRDHGVNQPKVFALQVVNVTEHFGLGVM